MIADTASLELVANGNAMNEMKKDGMLVASEKLSTASTSGSAKAAAIRVPSNNISTALIEIHRGFSTFSTTSSLCSSDPNKACSLFVCCKNDSNKLVCVIYDHKVVNAVYLPCENGR